MKNILLNSDWKEDPRHANFDIGSLRRIQYAVEFWVKEGYHFVSLPWMAPEESMGWTRPEDAMTPEPSTHEGALVSSAEQAFLWLDHQNLLPEDGRGYIGWSPCFRHEPVYDQQHHHYFLKAELFIPCMPDVADSIMNFIARRTALSWRALAISEGRGDMLPEIAPTSKHSLDLMVSGVELGSYGVRKRMNGEEFYVYGTALAEPRWSRFWPKS